MRFSLIVIDGFYSDIDAMRATALGMEFNVEGNYPGRRSAPYRHDGIRAAIEKAVQEPITYWDCPYNGAFQIAMARDQTWVHADDTTTWGGVLFMTPDAPIISGTAFYRHRATGLERRPTDSELRLRCDRDGVDRTRWDAVDHVGNVYNRLVLFDSARFHASETYFGQSLEDGRLFQTFFFSTG